MPAPLNELVMYASVMGLAAGLSPGPLLALVISQTLRHGAIEGYKVAAAPVLTDGPIIAAALLTYTAFALPPALLGAVTLAGAVVLAVMGIGGLRFNAEQDDQSAAAPRSLLKACMLNWLSPHPYLFWFTIGAPLALRGASVAATLAFIGTFTGILVGAKAAVAFAIGSSRQFVQGTAYVWTIRGLGLLLLVFAARLAADGVRMLS
ncbi:MAG: LysE family transporter [Gammaproteobacteria bacterium]|nr:LysE family transporter [Gammaproteobacteria bacterium]